MQRRKFIASGIGLLAYAGLGTAATVAGQGAGAALSAARFAAMLNQPFTIYDSVRGIRVQLVSVKEAPASRGLHQFTLTFAGAAEDSLDSGTYEVEHAATGKQLMYLDAHKRGKAGVVYRADFNLLA